MLQTWISFHGSYGDYSQLFFFTQDSHFSPFLHWSLVVTISSFLILYCNKLVSFYLNPSSPQKTCFSLSLSFYKTTELLFSRHDREKHITFQQIFLLVASNVSILLFVQKIQLFWLKQFWFFSPKLWLKTMRRLRIDVGWLQHILFFFVCGLGFISLASCLDGDDYSKTGNPKVLVPVTNLIYNRLQSLKNVLKADIDRDLGYCIKNL